MAVNQLLQETGRVLEDNILRYWLALEAPGGGFYGEALSDGTVLPDAPRGEILHARIVWAFAAAGAALRRPDYLAVAARTGKYFLEHFLDPVAGGVYWSVDAKGRPLDTKKQLYAQGFAIYGLSELYRATGDLQALQAAQELFRTIEKHFADPQFGGYIEALARDFSPLADMSLSAHDINADKTMNSHLHILEAYTNLYSVWPDPALLAALKALIGILGHRILGADGHLQLYFRRDWSVLPGAISYGHDIETSWLLLEAALATSDETLIAQARIWSAALGKAGNEGLLPDGSMRYERLPDGTRDDSRQWWVQAETVVGNLWLWRHHDDAEGLSQAMACWAYIREHLLRPEGEWHWAILPDGSPDRSQPVAGFWKCPYHNTRMCLQVASLLNG